MGTVFSTAAAITTGTAGGGAAGGVLCAQEAHRHSSGTSIAPMRRSPSIRLLSSVRKRFPASPQRFVQTDQVRGHLLIVLSQSVFRQDEGRLALEHVEEIHQPLLIKRAGNLDSLPA